VGTAKVVLSPTDFGSFLTHPLLARQSPSVPGRETASRFLFSGENVRILSRDEGDRVIFFGEYAGEPWKCGHKEKSF